MRMTHRAAAFAAAGLLLAACSDAPTGAARDAEATLKQQVAALGFRADMIEDHGDYVLVEGDIRISKEQLATVRPRSSDPRAPDYQYRTTAVVSSAKVSNILVDVSGLASEAGWQAAAREALTHWSGISGSGVRLVESGPADVTVSTACTSSNVAAFASFPSGGNPGSTIYVNTCFAYSTSHAQKVHNMVHEFGHTLGFRHSNYTQQGEAAGTEGAVLIPGTPTSGNATGSVMNGGTALNSWAGFAASDVTAAGYLYPLTAPDITSVTNSGGFPLITWNAAAGATSYTVTLITYSTLNGQYQSRGFNTLGTTAGTTYLDTGHAWTGQSTCTGYYDERLGGARGRWFEYAVQANYSTGSSPIDNARHYAYIAREICR